MSDSRDFGIKKDHKRIRHREKPPRFGGGEMFSMYY
jgi:hypothetical protein